VAEASSGLTTGTYTLNLDTTVDGTAIAYPLSVGHSSAASSLSQVYQNNK